MSEILKVGYVPEQDNTIIKKQFHTYSPYTAGFENSDEVRIAIQSQDLYLLPSESYICVDVNITRKIGLEHAQTQATWTPGHAACLFSEIRY